MQLKKLWFKTRHFDSPVLCLHQRWSFKLLCDSFYTLTNARLFLLARRQISVFMWRNAATLVYRIIAKFYYYAKFERNFAIALYTNTTVSSRDWKTRIRCQIKGRHHHGSSAHGRSLGAKLPNKGAHFELCSFEARVASNNVWSNCDLPFLHQYLPPLPLELLINIYIASRKIKLTQVLLEILPVES